MGIKSDASLDEEKSLYYIEKKDFVMNSNLIYCLKMVKLKVSTTHGLILYQEKHL
jgi:hypothetical protein